MRYSILTKLLDFVQPRRCVACGQRLSAAEEVVCSVCQFHITYADFHLAPFDNPMARLFWGQMPLEKAAALFLYAPQAQTSQLVYALKYYNRPDAAFALGATAARRFADVGFFDGIDALVPVPLSPKRERQRGYNQSREIALGVAEQTGLPVLSQVVGRTTFVQSQTRLSGQERRENVDGVFALRNAEAISGKHLLLIDDIVTTGATMMACGTVLLRAEGVRLSILSLGFTHS